MEEALNIYCLLHLYIPKTLLEYSLRQCNIEFGAQQGYLSTCQVLPIQRAKIQVFQDNFLLTLNYEQDFGSAAGR